jgi:hypothetical protein
MKVEMWSGTPSHHHTLYGDTQPRVKNWLLARVKEQTKWAEAYNLEMKAELAAISEQISFLNVQAMKVDSTREWSVTDQHTGVVLVYGCRKVEN